MSKQELPEFTAEEINRLRNKIHGTLDNSRIEYYQRCIRVVEDHESGKINSYSDKVVRWLWGIKLDLKGD